MSLIRQIRLLLLGVVLLAIVGAVTVNVLSARDMLQTQLRLKNSDNAQALALALSQQRGDPALLQLLMAAQFDTGFYRRIRLVRADGAVAFERGSDSAPADAPRWFARLVPIESAPGVAQVSDGWRVLGTLELVSHVAFAHDHLWHGALRAIGWMTALGVAAALLAGLAVQRIRRPLDATVEQAQALVEGRYVTVDESKVPELKRLSGAMNSMVQRMRALFEAQAAQLESLRRQAHCDPLTGLAHRAHFMERLQALLQREDGADEGGLVLVRLSDPATLNLALGREATDCVLLVIAHALQAYPDRVPDCVIGRLNGSDFALALPVAGMAAETAESLAAALRSRLPAFGALVQAHVGGVELSRGMDVGALMAQADHALARAESRGPFAVEVMQDVVGGTAAAGERAWREQIASALAQRRSQLVEYPVLDRKGALSHLECPLRLQLADGGEFEPAARWLPLAARARLTPQVDIHAVELALAAIERDGRARGVNIAAASLADGGFAPHLRHLLQERPRLARQLWLEVGESAAVEQFGVLQEFGRLLRPLGARFGLEHAGQRLGQIERLFELGLDYVKLDAALCGGVAGNPAAREFVKTSAALLHALSVQVHAEGVADAADAQALWDSGVDAITGPWAR